MDHAWKTGEGGRPFTCFFTEMKISAKKNVPTLTKLKQSCVMVRMEVKEKENRREPEQRRTGIKENKNERKQK